MTRVKLNFCMRSASHLVITERQASRRCLFALISTTRLQYATRFSFAARHVSKQNWPVNRLLHTSSILNTGAVDKSSNFEVINIQDEKDFEKHVINSKTPIILDFHATWCGPCKLLAPRLEKILGSHDKTINLAKVDVDKLEDLADKYLVKGVPAVFAVKDGKVVDKFVGLQDEDVIEAFVEKMSR